MTSQLLLALGVSLCACSPDAVQPPAAPTPPAAPKATAAASAPASAAPTASAAPAASASAVADSDKPEREPDIEYVPTPQNVVDKMLEVAKVQKGDVLYDLGCGDGRIVVTAAKKFGVKAMGFDIDPKRVRESRENVKKAGVENLVTIEQRDIFKIDLSPATVVTLYLLPELNVQLVPQLEKLKPGSRIVSHDFDMEGVQQENVWTLLAPDHVPPHKDREHYVYLWKTPLKKVAVKKK